MLHMGKALPELIHDPGGVLRAGVEQDHTELLASVASDDIRSPQSILKQTRKRAQNFVPRKMPIAVIDALEVIDIQKQERARPSIPLLPGQGLVQPILEQRPVRQTGEAVVERQACDLPVCLTPLEGIANRALEHIGTHISLDQIVGGTCLQRLQIGLPISLTGQHNHRGIDPFGRTGSKQFQSGTLPQPIIEQIDIMATLFDYLERCIIGSDPFKRIAHTRYIPEQITR